MFVAFAAAAAAAAAASASTRGKELWRSNILSRINLINTLAFEHSKL